MIALIAGRGRLPGALFAELEARGTPPVICSLDEQAADVPSYAQILTFRIETLGSALKALSDRGVTAVCLCGAMTRPEIDVAHVDPATAPLMGAISAAMSLGDDGTLRALISILEQAGFEIVPAQAILPDLLLPAGVPTAKQPAPSP